MAQQDKPDYADCCNRWPDCKHDEGQQDSERRDELEYWNGRKCLACGMADLFIGNGWFVTCSNADCPQPDFGVSVNNLIEQERLRAQLELVREQSTHNLLDKAYAATKVRMLQARLDKLTQL